jgi:hypothetical protein
VVYVSGWFVICCLQDCIRSCIFHANHRHISQLKIKRIMWDIKSSFFIHWRGFMFHSRIVYRCLLCFGNSHKKRRIQVTRNVVVSSTFFIIWCVIVLLVFWKTIYYKNIYSFKEIDVYCSNHSLLKYIRNNINSNHIAKIESCEYVNKLTYFI